MSRFRAIISHSKKRESPFVSFTELLTGALIIFVLLIIILALNQRGAIDAADVIQRDIALMEGERLRIAQALIDAEAQKNGLNSTVRGLQIQIGSLTQEQKEIEERISGIKIVIGALHTEVNNLRAERSTLEVAISIARSRMNELQGRINALTQDIKDKQEEANATAARVATLKAEEARLRALIAIILNDVKTMTTERDALARDVAGLRIAIGNLARQRAAHEAAVAGLAQQQSAAQANLAETNRKQTEAAAKAAEDAAQWYQQRVSFLNGIGEALRRGGLSVEIDTATNALIMSNESLFDLGSAEISSPQQLKSIKDLASALSVALSCQARTTPMACKGNPPPVSTVLIEGHADTVGAQPNNWTLSTKRAYSVYAALQQFAPELLTLRNNVPGSPAGHYLFGISGYGETRPRRPTADEVNEPLNRRIEIRFIFRERE